MPTRILLIIVILTCYSSFCKAQNCSFISGAKDKKKGIETFGGITNSKDFYSLLIQKEINLIDTTIQPKYILYLNAASKVSFSDSMLTTFGTFELSLFDSSKMILDSVSYFNNPLGSCCSIGFKTYLIEQQIRILLKNPITTINVTGILSTSFKTGKQLEQQKIINCLLNKRTK